jgi:hypothetical protein
MILKSLAAAAFGAGLMLGSAAQAEAYSPGDFLKLELYKAVLSPIPLGPPAQFERLPIEAKSDAAKNEFAPKIAKAPVRTRRLATVKKPLRPRSNPLDANASDTRVQVWPCRSGGICNWKK